MPSHTSYSMFQILSLLCCIGVVVVTPSEAVAERSVAVGGPMIQVGRYSAVAATPTAGQQNLLSVATAIDIPHDIKSVGDAVHWVLRSSGYRLAADSVLTEEVKDVLELPLPDVHRHFEPLPLSAVIGLMMGPSFRLVQDPIHRLISFERCGQFATSPSTGSER